MCPLEELNKIIIKNVSGYGDKRVAIIFSGGLDSTILVSAIKYLGYEPIPITFNDNSYTYLEKEKVAISNVLNELGMSGKAIELPFMNRMNFMLQDKIGFNPGLKMLMQVMAMSYCSANSISEIYMGYLKEDVPYCDEKIESIKKTQNCFNEIYEGDTIHIIGYRKEPTVRAPWINFTKHDILKIAEQVKAPLHFTHSCKEKRMPGLVHCGNCRGCNARKTAFKEANMEDNILFWGKEC